MPIRILLADDHGILRAGLRNLLNLDPDLEVIGEAADGAQVLRIAEQLQPDLILMDINMPNMGGIEALQSLSERLPAVKVLMLTVHEDESLLREICRYANAVGAITTTERGAIPALPTAEQVEKFLQTQGAK